MSSVIESTASFGSQTITATAEPLGWRVNVAEIEPNSEIKEPKTVSFNEANAVFAIDISGSVSGGILKTEKKLCSSVATSSNHLQNSKIIAWDHSARSPIPFSSINSLSANGGTDPSCILKGEDTAQAVEQSDVWFLVTDGSISPGDVEIFASLIVQRNITHIPAIIVVVGYAPTSNQLPANASISVGASVFFLADHCLFLYVDSSEWNSGMMNFYLLQAKGCFEQLGVVQSLDQSVQWHDLAIVAPVALSDIILPITTRATSGTLRLTDTLHIRLDTLLSNATNLTGDDIHDLFEDEAGRTTLLRACKARGLLPQLRTLISRHKVEMLTTNEDVADAQGALNRLSQARQAAASIDTLLELQRKLREAYAENERHNHAQRDTRREKASAINSILSLALQEMHEIEKAGYSAEQLGRLSNRAARAEVVLEADISGGLEALNFNPMSDEAYRGECPICCEEDAIMALTCKVLPADKTEENTNDFALNFPLACGSAKHNADVISAQIACYRCAEYTVNVFGRSIVREEATVTLPLVSWAKNKKLWRMRLAVALANRLQVGNLGQLFMAILHETLDVKGWAQAAEGDSEAGFRRGALEWTLAMLWREFETRENFQETGEYVPFPKAVAFIINEASQAGGSVEPFLIRYPLEGFLRIMDLTKKYQLPGRPLDDGVRLLHTRLMALLVDNYLASIKRDMFQAAADRIWAALYDLRHGKTPIDGSARIVTSAAQFIYPADAHKLAAYLGREAPEFPFPAAATIILRRLLEITHHDSVIHCVTVLRTRDPAVIQALDHPYHIVDADAFTILNEMFVPMPLAELTEDPHMNFHNSVPFVTPYGPSAIRCGYCGKGFAPPGTRGTIESLALRLKKGRQEHLVKYLDATGDTGLPLKAKCQNGRLLPPCRHYNLHHSIVLIFASQTEEKRDNIVRAAKVSEEDRTEEQRAIIEVFVDDVVEYIVTVDMRGNIYKRLMEGEVRSLVPGFCALVTRDGFNSNMARARLVDKLKMELQMLGWLEEIEQEDENLERKTELVGEIRE